MWVHSNSNTERENDSSAGKSKALTWRKDSNKDKKKDGANRIIRIHNRFVQSTILTIKNDLKNQMLQLNSANLFQNSPNGIQRDRNSQRQKHWHYELSPVPALSESERLVHRSNSYKPYGKECLRTPRQPILPEGNILICSRWCIYAGPETVDNKRHYYSRKWRKELTLRAD